MVEGPAIPWRKAAQVMVTGCREERGREVDPPGPVPSEQSLRPDPASQQHTQSPRSPVPSDLITFEWPHLGAHEALWRYFTSQP